MVKANSKKRIAIVCGLIICLIVCAWWIIGDVGAKYVRSREEENVAKAKEFYFTSNLLQEEGAAYVLNFETESVTFSLGNNADELRFSEDPITYTVTVNEGSFDKNDTAIQSVVGVLKTGSVSTDTVTLYGLEKGVTYTVTAVGEAGYKKTLTATFELATDGENVYKHLDLSNDEFVVLTVWTENVKGKLSVVTEDEKGKAVENLIPDGTDPILGQIINFQDGKYGKIDFTDEVSFVDSGFSSRTYRFFRNENDSYSSSDFNVILKVEKDGQEVKHPAGYAVPK